MNDVQGAVTQTHYKQYIQYHIVRDALEEVKVLIHYVESKDQHTDVRPKASSLEVVGQPRRDSHEHKHEMSSRIWYVE